MRVRTELDVLVEQLEELLDEGAIDGSDAIEIAMVAGLAARLGASEEVMAEALAWRAGPGGPLLQLIWQEIAEDDPLEELEALVTQEPDDEPLEEAVYDIDDLIAAAVWCGCPERVTRTSARLANLIRDVPEVFEPMAELGAEMAQMRVIGEHYDVYGYWFALADLRNLPEA
jgi:hypothetical protein